MPKLLIFLVIFQFSCLVSSTDDENEESNLDWVFVSDFEPSELANLTSQEEHRLMLKSLLKKKSSIDLSRIIYWEVLAKCAGIEFFGMLVDEKFDRENTAIIRATFEYMTKLQYHDRASKALENSFMKNFMGDLFDNDIFYMDETQLAKTFTRICSGIDERLKNENFYTKLRDEYKKNDYSQPKKTYLYGIPKSEDALREELAEFANDRQLKNISAHVIFLYQSEKSENKWPAKKILRSLARVPGKSEAVQKIYDESIRRLSSKMTKITPKQVDVDKVFERDNKKLAKILYKSLKEKVEANADLQRQIKDWETPLCKPSAIFL